MGGRASVGALVHILEQLCKLLMREPGFNGWLFILRLDSVFEYQDGKTKSSESINAAVHMLSSLLMEGGAPGFSGRAEPTSHCH